MAEQLVTQLAPEPGEKIVLVARPRADACMVR